MTGKERMGWGAHTRRGASFRGRDNVCSVSAARRGVVPATFLVPRVSGFSHVSQTRPAFRFPSGVIFLFFSLSLLDCEIKSGRGGMFRRVKSRCSSRLRVDVLFPGEQITRPGEGRPSRGAPGPVRPGAG